MAPDQTAPADRGPGATPALKDADQAQPLEETRRLLGREPQV
nr:hypothetical protein OH837_11765 [Streptomyces canus]